MIALFLALIAAATETAAPASDAAAGRQAAAENVAATVSLSGLLTLDDVCAEIERQTGNKITDYRGHVSQNITNPQFKLEIKNAPFWQAVDALLDSTKMTVYHYSGKDGLAIVNRAGDELPRSGRATYVGPLRLEVTRIIAQRQPALKTSGLLQLNLAIAWEPRLEPLMIVQPLTQIQAIDDQGHALKFDREEATLEAPIEGGGTGVGLVFSFVPPPRSVNAIASLKGTLNVSLPGKVEAFEFDKLVDAAGPRVKPVEQKKGATAVSLDQVRKNNEIWEVLTRIRFDEASSPSDAQHNWIFQNEVYLLGPDHNRIDHAGFHTTERTGNEIGVIYQFELPGGMEGCTFVYRSPTSLHLLPVEYELKNLQLP
ncbi:MAG TPA: hypothetical protein VFE46_07055 [Pirellulales bacterium]|nr:hypothetical protein [Pirellulales bacterium]